VSFNIIEIDGVGVEDERLKVETQALTPPTGTTAVKRFIDEDISGNSSEQDVYIIPNGASLKITGLSMTCERANSSSMVELFYAPSGSLDGAESLLFKVILEANDSNDQIAEQFTGDGVASIILVATRMGSGRRVIFTKWWGYYV